MSHAAARGWGPAGSGRMVLVPCRGIPLRVRAEVAPLFAHLVITLDRARRAHGLPPLSSSGGLNVRPKRGREARYAASKDPGLLSEHSWGLAGDFNAPENPMRQPMRTDMPPETAAIAAACSLSWGGLWSGTPDPMHFEYLGTPATAARDVARLTQLEDQDMTPEQDARLKWVEAHLKEIGPSNENGRGVHRVLDSGDGAAIADLVREVRALVQSLPKAVLDDALVDVQHPLTGAAQQITLRTAIGRGASVVRDLAAAVKAQTITLPGGRA